MDAALQHVAQVCCCMETPFRHLAHRLEAVDLEAYSHAGTQSGPLVNGDKGTTFLPPCPLSLSLATTVGVRATQPGVHAPAARLHLPLHRPHMAGMGHYY